MHLHRSLVGVVVALAMGAALVRTHPWARAPADARPPSISVAIRPGDGDRSRRTGERSVTASRAVPRASARAIAPATIVVYVAGDVRRPGLFTLPTGSRAADALRAAGGAHDDADLVAVNLASRLDDGDEIAVVARGASSGTYRRSRGAGSRGAILRGGVVRNGPSAHRGPGRSRGHKRKRRLPHERGGASDVSRSALDLNSATASDLQTLPGIGPALAERIVAMREQSGPFASSDDLLDVGGMTQGRLDAILPYVVAR